MSSNINNITRLLCATDGSKSSEKAVEYALSLASTRNDIELVFLLVTRMDVSLEDALHLGTMLLDSAKVQEHMELAAAAESANKIGFTNFKCVKIDSRRNIAAAIVHYAEKEALQHIVMGSTGKTGVVRVMLGSVAEEVVRKAHCAITIVR